MAIDLEKDRLMIAQSNRLWDVAIIGAGPGGSLLSLILARSGLSVVLLDQSRFPRRKVCGGCLNGNAIAVLQQCGVGHLPEQLGARPVQRMQLCAGRRSVELFLQNNWSLSRESLDTALIEEARRSGVSFYSGQRAKLGASKDDRRQVNLQSESECSTMEAKVVVIAHGLKAGTVARRSRIGVGTILNEAPRDRARDRLVMVVGRGGYVGGVGVENGQYDLAAALDVRFLKAKGSISEAVNDILRQSGMRAIDVAENADWKGTPLLTRRPEKIAGERWFAVGDAAGYVEPFTGEGIAWAMNGALALGPIVERAVRQWHPEMMQHWSRLHHRQIARRQWPCRVLSQVLRSTLLSQGLVVGVKRFPGLANPVLHHLNRPSASVTGALL